MSPRPPGTAMAAGRSPGPDPGTIFPCHRAHVLRTRMRRRIFVVAGEYSANPRHLPPERRGKEWLMEPHPELADEEVTRLFFRYPNRRDDGHAKAEDWRREFGLESPPGL